jgi:hypothetical protein
VGGEGTAALRACGMRVRGLPRRWGCRLCRSHGWRVACSGHEVGEGEQEGVASRDVGNEGGAVGAGDWARLAAPGAVAEGTEGGCSGTSVEGEWVCRVEGGANGRFFEYA